jgi:ATP-dependent Clp protease ATP-binding subunit ClpA/ATP-dependent Clp protease ATP-binding subunit ClpC
VGALREALRAAASHLAMRVAGLCVLDFFALEQGSHVWSALGRGPEIVRVRVSPAMGHEPPAARIREHDAQQRAYDEAAHRGLPLPPNPGALLPLVRSIHFEPPRRPGTTAPLSMEDYVIGTATTVEARSIAEALAPLWLLRASREADS